MVLKELILTASTLGGSDGLETTEFKILLLAVVVVFKKLIFNSFYFGTL